MGVAKMANISKKLKNRKDYTELLEFLPALGLVSFKKKSINIQFKVS